jgi:hypothetical protein
MALPSARLMLRTTTGFIACFLFLYLDPSS